MPDILYEKLSGQLEMMIRSGEFGSKLPGLHKLAKILGANHITVRKAIELLIDRGYLEVIPSCGTFIREKKNPVRNFRMIGCIGVFCGSLYREMVFNRQNDRIRESGYKILDIAASSQVFRDNPLLLLQFPVDGYIFFGDSLSRQMMQLLLDNRIPLISMLNSNFPEINQVGMDHFHGYAEALKALRQYGCRRIAFLNYRRQGDFKNYIEDIRGVFIRELGSAFEPELFSVYSAEDYFLRYGEDYHRVIAGECVRSWGNKPPDGLISIPEVVPTVKQFFPAIRTAVFSLYGGRCESDIVMYEDMPELLDAAVRRMLDLFAGDSSIAENRIRFIRKDALLHERKMTDFTFPAIPVQKSSGKNGGIGQLPSEITK